MSEQKGGEKVEVNSSNELVKCVQDRYFFDAIRINEEAPAVQDTTRIQIKKRKGPGH